MTAPLPIDDAVARFLGARAAQGGPHNVLGLPMTGFSDSDVLAARDRQLRVVDEHPESLTPAADEVRLAVHAATAQLLHPAVRDRLHEGSMEHRRQSAMLQLQQDVVLTLGMFGGWSRRCLPRLVALAHARGLKADDVAQAVRSISTRRKAAGSPAGGGGYVGAVAEAGLHDEHTHAWWWIALVAAVSLSVSAGVIWWAVQQKSERNGDRTASLAPDHTMADALVLPPPRPMVEPSGASPASARTEVPAAQIVETLEGALAMVATDPSSAERVGIEAVRALAHHWLDLAPPVRTRAHDLVVELMYRVGGSSMDARGLLEAVGEGAALLRPGDGRTLDREQLARASWAVGMLTRLRRENELSAQNQSLIDRQLGAALQGVRPVQLSFAEGAISALQVMAELLASQEQDASDVWKAWADAVTTLTLSDTSRRALLLARGAELMLTSPGPAHRRADRFESIACVIAAMPWKQSPECRSWFVRQFDNRDVDTPTLSAATQALVARSEADGVDPTMVLAATASDLDRRSLRDRYITAWGLDEAGSGVEVLDRLVDAAREIAPELAGSAEPEEMLRSAVELARLNAAAAAAWQGDGAAALRLLDAYKVPDLPALPGATDVEGMPEGNANWAERYLAAGANIEKRLELLRELRSSSRADLSVVDAEVLVAEAIRGSGSSVRDAAMELVDLYGSSVHVVNALLEESPRMPPVQGIADLIVNVTASPLPDRNSPSWRAAVRRALVERLLQLLAAEGKTAGIDTLASFLDDAYMERVIVTQAGPSSGDALTPAAERSAGLLRARWTRLAERAIASPSLSLSLDEIERRRAGRASLANGLVQRFVVEQSALGETMGYVVAAERPGAAPAVQAVLDRMERQLQRATHVFEQVALVERAMLDLWMIRLGLDVPREEG
ncbi:MAG: hypothetical protein Kow0022_03990 [Phycisphaerales bacterium]